MSMKDCKQSSLFVCTQGLLSNVRTKAGDNCMTSLSRHNSPLIMSQCGSKGSPVNIAQMVACVGQQVLTHTPMCYSAISC